MVKPTTNLSSNKISVSRFTSYIKFETLGELWFATTHCFITFILRLMSKFNVLCDHLKLVWIVTVLKVVSR